MVISPDTTKPVPLFSINVLLPFVISPETDKLPVPKLLRINKSLALLMIPLTDKLLLLLTIDISFPFVILEETFKLPVPSL